MRSADLVYHLGSKIQRINATPQTAGREEALCDLKLQRDILLMEREIKVLRLQRLLFDAYKRNGAMCVRHPSGQQRTERPEYGGSAIQHIWNAFSKARCLAEWATP